uniref:Wings apart-like n=1 Tax=Anthurium amnicola TaxID=1678845 RepID=A0A1D1YY17_9ARAE
MIVRTYGRRSRCAGGGFSDAALTDGSAEMDDPLSLSQETSSSQPDPYGFAAFSSQDSSPWSFDSDIFGPDDLAAAPVLPPLPPPPPRPPGNSLNDPRRPRDRKDGRAKKPELPPPARPRSLPRPPAAPSATATLMEAQEFGEMMEHLDEVNFSLDGLRAGQPARIRQASLLSLLTICATAQQRRFLRAQGMSKRIIDAVVGLSIDDSASSIAAAALFYILASDVPDDRLLDSPLCINFLLKLLKPPVAGSVDDKVPNIGSRLLGVSNAVTLNGMHKKIDSSSTSIISKVQEILVSCKELKPSSQDDDATERPEISSKWIALLTLEKACLSSVSIEDTSGTVSRVGGNFKERLRELGGLDAIFNVAASCYSKMEGWLKRGFPSFQEFRRSDFQSIVLLLKCFKIMENATFLSNDNQNHLLGMRPKPDNEGLPLSFVRLVINAMKIFSDLSLRKSNSCISTKQSNCLSNDDCSWPSSGNSGGFCGIERSSYTEKPDSCQKRQRLSATEFDVSIADSQTTVAYDVSCSMAKVDPYLPISCNTKLDDAKGRLTMNAKVSNINHARGSNGWISLKISKAKINSINSSGERFTSNGNEVKGSFLSGSNSASSMDGTVSKMSSVQLGKRPHATMNPRDDCMRGACDPFTFDEDDVNGLLLNSVDPEGELNALEEPRDKSVMSSHDPFAFDEDELGPSKWEMLATRKETSERSQSMVVYRELENAPELLSSNPESTKEANRNSDNSCPSAAEEDTNLLEDCLLTAVKVLMNLTNDNPVGCQQIAACGGLDTLATLITSHFPSFDFLQPVYNQLDENISESKSSADTGPLENKYLNDHELDFLVAILGLLVNLVEKDIQNRSRLAAASVSMACSGRPEHRGSRRDVISLLCCIFMSNRGAGEAAGEGRLLPCDDEVALLQGEREAEMMIIEAYAALLLAFLSTESKKSREAIAGFLPDQNLEVLVPVLERFVAFHVSLNMISPETHSIVSEVIESCKGS